VKTPSLEFDLHLGPNIHACRACPYKRLQRLGKRELGSQKTDLKRSSLRDIATHPTPPLQKRFFKPSISPQDTNAPTVPSTIFITTAYLITPESKQINSNMSTTTASPELTTSPATTTASSSSQTTSQSRLQKTTSHLKYLYSPTTANQPARLRTRTLLRSFRYLALFIFWRVVRYAKYAATGALVAAVSGTAIGSVVSGVGFLVAPTGILGGAGVGLVWALAKFGWKRAGKGSKGAGEDPRRDEREDAEGAEGAEDERALRVPRTEPW
jgi:hypothetical protein